MKALAAIVAWVACPFLLGEQAHAESQPEADEPSWVLAASAAVYFVPGAPDYVQPTASADHHALHLEARYSYEDLLTGSAWAGYNLSGGATVSWSLTPMVGAIFGRTWGGAPGYEGSLGWWKLELYSEGEYVFDAREASDSFFFNWSELTLAPVEWFYFGLVTQRTRIFSSGRVVERGVLAGLVYGPATLTGYVLNPDDAKPIVIVALDLTFET